LEAVAVFFAGFTNFDFLAATLALCVAAAVYVDADDLPFTAFGFGSYSSSKSSSSSSYSSSSNKSSSYSSLESFILK
jgi:hypothetical protein